MSDDTTTTDESTDTLTLRAHGDVEVGRQRDTDRLTAMVTERKSITVEFAVDAADLDDIGAVHKHGAHIDGEAVAEVAADELADDDAEWHPADDWEVTLSGRVDEWTHVAVGAAKIRRGSLPPNARVLGTACAALDDWVEVADSDRPILAMLDIVSEHEVEGYTREGVLNRLTESPTDADAAAEVPADD